MAFYPAHCDNICKGCEKKINLIGVFGRIEGLVVQPQQ